MNHCPRCKRFHRVDESTCPFCQAKRRAGPAAAIAMLALTACPGLVRSVYAGPPPQPDPPADAEDGSEPEAQPEPEAEPSEEAVEPAGENEAP